jgi:hypothetical protein
VATGITAASNCLACPAKSFTATAGSTACSPCRLATASSATSCFDRTNVLEVDGKLYSTLADVSVDANVISCQASYLSIPAGWSIAQNTDQIVSRVVIQHFWSSPSLVLADGSAIVTAQFYDKWGSGSEVVSTRELSVIDNNKYMPVNCNSQILLVLVLISLDHVFAHDDYYHYYHYYYYHYYHYYHYYYYC